jgi:hypothetical protein
LWTIDEVLEKHLANRQNKCEWTYELAAAMLSHSVAHPSNEDPSRISTTSLTTKCMRRQTLERHTDYTVRLDQLYAAFRGTLLHGQLEAFVSPSCYGEVRFVVNDLGVQIPSVKKALPRKDRSFTGSPDLVDPNIGILYDYKRTKEVPRFNTVWGDHIEQLNINRWLVDHADRVEVRDPQPEALAPVWFADGWTDAVTREGNKASYDLKHPFVRERFVPVEWQELVIVYVDDKGPKPITATESIDVPAKTTGGTKKARVPAIWSDERVEAFIAERYIAARTALTTGLAPIPVGWENQSHPLCNYCHVRDLCARLEREGC